MRDWREIPHLIWDRVPIPHLPIPHLFCHTHLNHIVTNPFQSSVFRYLFHIWYSENTQIKHKYVLYTKIFACGALNFKVWNIDEKSTRRARKIQWFSIPHLFLNPASYLGLSPNPASSNPASSEELEETMGKHERHEGRHPLSRLPMDNFIGTFCCSNLNRKINYPESQHNPGLGRVSEIPRPFEK